MKQFVEVRCPAGYKYDKDLKTCKADSKKCVDDSSSGDSISLTFGDFIKEKWKQVTRK